jgi:hypothetical protein
MYRCGHPSHAQIALHSAYIARAVNANQSSRFGAEVDLVLTTVDEVVENDWEYGLAWASLLYEGTPAATYVVCLIEGGTAHYALLNPCDSQTQVLIHRAHEHAELRVVSEHAGRAHQFMLGVTELQDFPASLVEGQAANADWLLHAAALAQGLPHYFVHWIPELRDLADHRAYLVNALDR